MKSENRMEIRLENRLENKFLNRTTTGASSSLGSVDDPTQRPHTQPDTQIRENQNRENQNRENLNSMEEMCNPLARTLLKGIGTRNGQKSLLQLTRRQTTETVNMKSVSPLMQEYFSSSVLAPVKMALGAQMMHRTVPVSWCATGGADTHRKRIVHTDLHQDITDRGKEAEKDFLKASYLGKKSRSDNLRLINNSCTAVLKSDSATIGRFSLDLVKRQQQQRKNRNLGGINRGGDRKSVV